MTDTLDTYIKSPAPPKDPDAQYVYNEQQFGALEKALKKQHDKILEVNDNASALYQNEVIVRTTADSSLVQTIETLDAKVDLNNTTTQATISNIQTAFADSESATATKLSTLEAKVTTGDATNLALIRDEAKTRATKTDALASKISALEASVKTNATDSRAMVKQETIARATADSAEALKRENLSAYIGYTDGQSYTKTLAATVSDEAIARVTADGVLAQKVTYLSTGSSRVYTQTDSPGTTGRIRGDVWYDTDDSFRPYVWSPSVSTATDDTWRDNSTGVYSQYVGLNASVSTQLTALSNNDKKLAQSITQATVGGTTVLTQDDTPSTSGRTLGDVWYDTNDNYTPYVWSPSTPTTTDYAWRNNSTGAYSRYIGALATAYTGITALQDADKTLAQTISKATVGANNVYTQASQPAFGMVKGDIWYDTDDSFRPYVYAPSTDTGTDNAWRDNTAGAYSKFIGSIASVFTTATSAKTKADGLSYEWRVQGTTGTTSTGQAALILSGVQKNNADGSLSEVRKLVINANTEINGDLVVSGTIKGARIGTGDVDGINTANIVSYAVSDNQSNVAINAGSAAVYGMQLKLGDRVTIIGNGAGNAASGSDGYATMAVYFQKVSGPSGQIGSTQTASAFCNSGGLGYNAGIWYFIGSFRIPPSTIIRTFTCTAETGGAGSYNFSVASGVGGDTGIAVIRLSR